MSKSKDKKKKNLIDQAEFLWERAQVQAAGAQKNLDIAVETFKNFIGEMPEDQVKLTEQKIAEQQETIKDFLMAARDAYAARLEEASAIISE